MLRKFEKLKLIIACALVMVMVLPITSFADEAKLDAVYESAVQEVQDAIEHAKTAPEPSPDSLYNDIYSPEFVQRFGGEL